MGPTPVYGARAEKPLQNADFAMKQTNICRLSGDIIIVQLDLCSTFLQYSQFICYYFTCLVYCVCGC